MHGLRRKIDVNVGCGVRRAHRGKNKDCWSDDRKTHVGLLTQRASDFAGVLALAWRYIKLNEAVRFHGKAQSRQFAQTRLETDGKRRPIELDAIRFNCE